MALDAAKKNASMRRLVTSISRRLETIAITKPDILAAVTGIDDYLDANATAMNNAIPQPARGSLSAAQKSALFAAVMLERFGGDL